MWTKSMSVAARQLIIDLAGEPPYGRQVQWFKRIARDANISARAARRLWRGEIHDQNNRDAESVRRAIEIKKVRAEAQALARQYQAIIGGLRATDPAFFGEEITRLERIVRDIGPVDRA
jgi:enoyl reductase-like protein